MKEKKTISKSPLHHKTIEELIPLQKVFDAIPDLVAIIDRNHTIVSINKAMAEKLGTSIEGCINLPCYQSVHGLNEPPSFCPHILLLNDGDEHSVEVHEEKLGGDYLITATPLQDPNGTLIGCLHIARDINEKIKSKKLLDEQKFWLTESQRIARIGSYVLNVKSNVWTSSVGLDDIFGIDKDAEKTLLSWSELIHHEDRQMMMDHFMITVLKERQPFNKEYRVIRQNDHEIRWVWGHGEVEYSEEGEPVTMFGTIQDVTDLKKAEIELKDSELRYRTLIQVMPEGVVGIDASCNITFASIRTALLLRTGEDELIGSSILDFIVTEFREEAKININSVLEGNPLSDHEYTMVCKDGTQFPGEITCARLCDIKGNPVGAVSIIRDITERKKAENALKDSEKNLRLLNIELDERVRQRTSELEHAIKELETFSYTVSHDLRSPLRGIDGLSYALLEDYSDKVDDKGKKYLSVIRADVQKLSLLVDRLLEFSRVSRSEIKMIEVNLSVITMNCADRLKKIEPDRKVKFAIQPDVISKGDQLLLEVVLSNLIQNAWKFTQFNPEAEIEFGMKIEKNQQVYFLKDNGVGFDLGYTSRLFGAFQRFHKTSEFPGTGIGLATVKRIILRHGGTIWADSEPGKGATFYFTLKE